MKTAAMSLVAVLLFLAIPGGAAQADDLAAAVAGNKGVHYGRVIWVLDILRRLGIEQYALNIDPSVAADYADSK